MDSPSHSPWVFILSQALYGHTQAVTCLAASVTFSLLVSGSQDRTCILWDLDRLVHVARLPAHREGISAIAISDVSVRFQFLHVYVPSLWPGRQYPGENTGPERVWEMPVCGPLATDEPV